MTEIQGKSILVRVSEGSSYREATVESFSNCNGTRTARKIGKTHLKTSHAHHACLHIFLHDTLTSPLCKCHGI